jgi:hypothetical protein
MNCPKEGQLLDEAASPRGEGGLDGLWGLEGGGR